MLNLDLCCGFAVNRGAWAGCVGLTPTSACVCAGERWGLLNVWRKRSFIDSTFHILSRMYICSIKKKKNIYLSILGGTESHLRSERAGVGDGGRELPRIEQVVLQRERAAFAAARR